MAKFIGFEVSEDAVFLACSLGLLGMAMATLALIWRRARPVRVRRFWLLERNRKHLNVFMVTFAAGLLLLIYRIIHYLSIHDSVFNPSALVGLAAFVLTLVLYAWWQRQRRGSERATSRSRRQRVR